MPNRIFYASHGVSVGGFTVQGAQSVSVNTNFDLEQVFQLGRLAIYENLQNDPDVEVTINKVLDGNGLIWDLAATTGSSIIENANDTTTIVLAVGDDAQAALVSAAAITMTGMYVNSVNYTLPVDGIFTEEVSFIGSHKSLTGSVTAPAAVTAPAVRRRQNLSSSSTLPSEVNGKNISNITISADFGREKLYKLGQFSPFHRFVNFPLEVTVTFDVIAKSTDSGVDGVAASLVTGNCAGPSYTEQPIDIYICDHNGNTDYQFDLGSKCVLSSVAYSGGDTGGGNVTITYTYTTYNDLDIISP